VEAREAAMAAERVEARVEEKAVRVRAAEVMEAVALAFCFLLVI
jgi:hypothetical protein